MTSKTRLSRVHDAPGSSQSAENRFQFLPSLTANRDLSKGCQRHSGEFFFQAPPPDQPPRVPLRSIDRERPRRRAERLRRNRSTRWSPSGRRHHEQIWNTTSSLSRDCFSSRERERRFSLKSQRASGAPRPGRPAERPACADWRLGTATSARGGAVLPWTSTPR